MGDVMMVVSAAVIREDAGVKRLLLAQRKTGGSYPLAWCTPGGKVEPGETHIEALRWEIEEEVRVRLGRKDATWSAAAWKRLFAHEGTSTTTGKPYRLTCYTTTDERGVFRTLAPGDGIVGIGWFTANEVEGLTLAPADTANRVKLVEVLR
jgi:8-oxo-dGTP diphosphatase